MLGLALAQNVLSAIPTDVQNPTLVDFGGAVHLVGWDLSPNDKAAPVTSPGTESGAMTRRKVRSGEAPNVAEAAINLWSTAENDAANGWTAKGRL